MTGLPPGRAGTPRATPTFVGRESELARILDRVGSEAVFLICGVAGIGKTELAIRAVEQIARLRDRNDLRTFTVALRPGMHVSHAIAQLRLACRLTGRPGTTTLEDALGPIVEQLEETSALVRLDDVHVLPDEDAGLLLGYFARHLHTARVVATSRREIPIPVECPAPCVTRLAPLGAADARRMVERLAETLGVTGLDAHEIVRRCGGSPFYIRHQVATLHHGRLPAGGDVLELSLRQLDADARDVLLRIAVVEVPLEPAAFASDIAGGEAAFNALINRFLVDVRDGLVKPHDLVRDTVLRTTPIEERRVVYRWAVKTHLARFEVDPVAHVMHGLEVLRLLRAAGDRDQQLAFMLAHQRVISRAGLDHLLLESLEELRGGAPEIDFAIDLARAHILLRQSQIADARALLEARAEDPLATSSPAYYALVSSVAMRSGDLGAVGVALRAALALATTGGTRRRLTLYLTDLHSIRGLGPLARSMLGTAELAGGATSDTGKVRWLRSRLINLIFDQQFIEAADTARAHRLAVAPRALDLDIQIAMLEVVALAELGEATAARALVDEVLVPAARSGALREKVVRFYVGRAALAEGDLSAARCELEAAHAYVVAHKDAVMTGIAGHFLGRALLANGHLMAAYEMFAESTNRGERAGFALAALGRVYMARTLVELGRSAEARPILDAVLASSLGGRARALAHRVMARVCAAGGDPGAARHQLGVAALLVAGDASAALELAMDRAELELVHGDVGLAIDDARRALEHYAARGARYDEARAALVLATGHAVAGGRADHVIAREALAHARRLAEAGGYEELMPRCIVVFAALEVASGRRAQAQAQLAAAVAMRYTSAGCDVALLTSALEGVPHPALTPAQRALLAALGLVTTGAAPVDLTVDLALGSITAANGTAIRGRPLLCKVMVTLIEADGRPAGPEALYRAVWESAEYHPLRHRNTLYAAINRLRGVLAELLPDRGELIVTGPTGWYLRTAVVTTRILTSSNASDA
ncbi:MAG: hypothetical protein WKG01_34905 [Kofleriaceae bacterium]